MLSDGLRAGEFTATHTGPLTAAQMRGDDLAAYEWRVGGHGNCGILAMRGYDRDVDAAIGLMNTAELAAAVVDEHNAAITERAKAEGRAVRRRIAEAPDGR